MFFINPFIYGGAGGDFESIATATVGSGGASNVEFASIGTDWQHLQLRVVARTDAASTTSFMRLAFNGATTNLTAHYLQGNGSGTFAAFENTGSAINFGGITGDNASASIFGTSVLDILDYASTSKTKVTRALSGRDLNGSGDIVVQSGLWNSTSAITSLKVTPGSGSNFKQHSTFALYGVKAP